MKNFNLMLVVASSLSAVVTFAQDKKPEQKKEAPAPEIKKTVDAMLGNWVFEGTLTGMAKDPIKLKEAFACKKAAGGKAVSCVGKSNVPGIGAVEDESLVVWDTELKAIRFIGVSSMGDIHDHHCAWTDNKTMTCEPLALTAGGQPATVDLTATWVDGKTMTMTETTTMKDGTKVTYDGKAKR